MKTALLVVSFGTTHLDTLEKTIASTERCLANTFCQYPFYRAFVSGIVRSRLNNEYGITVDNVEDALARIAADGYTHVLLQPTLLIPGEEMDRLKASVETAKGSLTVSIGQPLLCCDSDLEQILDILQETYPADPETVLVMMGHGTEHSGNAIYEQLLQKMRHYKAGTMRLTTVEGTPSFTDTIAEVTEMAQQKAIVAPLLFVAGDHAKNDMAGEEEDSLRSLLEAQGFAVTCKLQGLGEIPGVQQMLIQKAKDAEKELC
jgi:sirohydrochlorin cobaltochelatase